MFVQSFEEQNAQEVRMTTTFPRSFRLDFCDLIVVVTIIRLTILLDGTMNSFRSENKASKEFAKETPKPNRISLKFCERRLLRKDLRGETASCASDICFHVCFYLFPVIFKL